MGIPETIICIALVARFAGAALRHGRREVKVYNADRTGLEALIALSLLYWGGFFS